MFEKVSPWHPDKLADRIAGAIVDMAYKQDTDPRIAVEVLIGHGECNIVTESSVHIEDEEICKAVKRITRSDYSVYINSNEQDRNLSAIQAMGICCADNGIFRGVCPNSEERMISALGKQLWTALPYDGKILFDDGHLVICQSNATEKEIRDAIAPALEMMQIIRPISEIAINPIGAWTGGPDVDTGATNRKLGSDMGRAVTGGGLHGKDLSKADVSVNIYLHEKAVRAQKQFQASCSIGGLEILKDGQPVRFDNCIDIARRYIQERGGFEKLAEWGLI